MLDVRTQLAPTSTVDPEVLDAAMRGWSENTRRAFRSDMALWFAWCRLYRTEPYEASPKLVAAWIRALAGIDATELKQRRPAPTGSSRPVFPCHQSRRAFSARP